MFAKISPSFRLVVTARTIIQHEWPVAMYFAHVSFEGASVVEGFMAYLALVKLF